jgi:NADP-dependent 3-hydroxy acid dehydrogenase YdfG
MASESEYLNSLFGLAGKTALITGGTRGIGAALIVALYVINFYTHKIDVRS